MTSQNRMNVLGHDGTRKDRDPGSFCIFTESISNDGSLPFIESNWRILEKLLHSEPGCGIVSDSRDALSGLSLRGGAAGPEEFIRAHEIGP
jgi:hypothetical protein